MTSKTPIKKQRVKAGRPSQAEPDKTRVALLDAAISLFAKKGFDGTSVKEISDRAGTNISLVSYYFGGKEGLYKTCLEDFGKHRLAATERLLQPPQTREEAQLRLEMFIDDMLIWFQEEPELCAIVQRESDMGFPIAKDVFESTFLKVFMTFVAFIKGGQGKGFLRPDFEAHIAASLMFGGLINMLKKDEVSKRIVGHSLQEPSYRKKLKNQVCRIFFDGLALAPAGPKQGVKK